LDNHVIFRRSQIEEISINKIITKYKNIKPSSACVYCHNGNSCGIVALPTQDEGNRTWRIH
jgi:hypothetical protein